MFDDSNFKIEIIRSFRTTMSINIFSDLRVVVRVPVQMKQLQVEEFIQKKRNWILKHLDRLKNNSLEKESIFVKKEDGVFYFLSKPYNIEVLEGYKINKVQFCEDRILVYRKNKDTNIKPLLRKFILIEAEKLFLKLINKNFEVFSEKCKPRFFGNYKLPTLKLRFMKTRWGSMSSNNIITLNVNLIKAPIECINYVIFHEFCHIKHQNHGKNFYKLQEKFVPNYKEIKKELNSWHLICIS